MPALSISFCLFPVFVRHLSSMSRKLISQHNRSTLRISLYSYGFLLKQTSAISRTMFMRRFETSLFSKFIIAFLTFTEICVRKFHRRRIVSRLHMLICSHHFHKFPSIMYSDVLVRDICMLSSTLPSYDTSFVMEVLALALHSLPLNPVRSSATPNGPAPASWFRRFLRASPAAPLLRHWSRWKHLSRWCRWDFVFIIFIDLGLGFGSTLHRPRILVSHFRHGLGQLRQYFLPWTNHVEKMERLLK